MIKKILVALDGSDYSNRALDFALDLAELSSANILLVSVAQSEYLPSLSNIKENNRELLSVTKLETEKARPKLKVSTKLVEGNPADEIIEVSEQENVDIIVVGSRGLSGIKEMFLGSVSDNIAHKASRPVLIVK